RSGRWRGRKGVGIGAWRGAEAPREQAPKHQAPKEQGLPGQALQEQVRRERARQAKRQRGSETFAQILCSSVSFGLALDERIGVLTSIGHRSDHVWRTGRIGVCPQFSLLP